MEYIRRNRSLMADGIGPELLLGCIKEHRQRLERLDRLYNYYIGQHKILERQRQGEYAPNNRLANCFPKYITDTAVGYVFGNPVAYSYANSERLVPLTDVLRRADINTHDAELGKHLSVFGIAYELAYISGQQPEPRIALVDPRMAFVVYDDTVEANPLMGATCFPRYAANGKSDGYTIIVYTSDRITGYYAKNLTDKPTPIGFEEPHYFGGVPLLEYWNNEEGMGDYEHVLDLIDAYDVLQSDRINDKEQFVNAILLILNGEVDDDTMKTLKNAVLNLPEGTEAKYLTKTLNEAETEILAKAMADNIHKFSQTPDFTDEKFSGNTSGVALSYKLMNLENLAKTKERYFVEGLRQRLALFVHFLRAKAQNVPDAMDIEIAFNRALPINELENAQTIAMLINAGVLSTETALTRIAAVKDKEAELARIRAERQERDQSRLDAINQPGLSVDDMTL